MKSITLTTSLLIAAFGLAGGVAAAERVVLPANVTPSHYDIAIKTDAAHLAFTGTVKIDIDVKQPANTIVLNAVDLAFGKVSLTGACGCAQDHLRHQAGNRDAGIRVELLRWSSRPDYRLYRQNQRAGRRHFSRSITTQRGARNARSSPSSRIPTRGGLSPRGTSPTRRQRSRWPRLFRQTRWRSRIRRSFRRRI